MRFYEALKEAQESGAKIRCKTWANRDFYLIYEEGGFVSNNGEDYIIEQHHFSYEWEIYEEKQEPKKLFEWAYKLNNTWFLLGQLMSITEAGQYFTVSDEYKKVREIEL